MIGIDVGGANLKVVDDTGAHIHYCPLWEKAPITEILQGYPRTEDAAVVMSGELADCFTSKQQGIEFIVRAVQAAFPNAKFYGTDAKFHDCPVPELAAANWLASADYFREKYPDALLIDVGSTTTDIIPLNMFDSLKGMTDLDRLRAGYLVYTGMLRTSIPTLIRTVPLGGKDVPVSTEYFATSADAHLVLGNITEEMYSCDTPDHKEKTVDASLRRLARVMCSDIDEIGTEGAMQVARAFWDTQRQIIRDAVANAARESGARRIFVAGIGSAVFARELNGRDLTQKLGQSADALPAFAVREIALRQKS